MTQKIIYANLSLDSIKLEDIAPIKTRATETLSHLLTPCQLFSKSGSQLSVEVNFADIDPRAVIFKTACASPERNNEYSITLGGGLLIRLDALAKAISFNNNQLYGHSRSKLYNAEARRLGRGEILHQICFHTMLTFISWHEIAHITLGHLDWLNENFGVTELDEKSNSSDPTPSILHRRTMEADADRQATLWTCATIDVSLKKNPLIKYSTLPDFFHDVGYIFSSLFCFLDAMENKNIPEQSRKHPKPQIRLGVVLSFCEEYFEKFYPSAKKPFQESIYAGGMKALKYMEYDGKENLNIMEIFSFMSSNGERIDNMKLREFQHIMKKGHPSSFRLA